MTNIVFFMRVDSTDDTDASINSNSSGGDNFGGIQHTLNTASTRLKLRSLLSASSGSITFFCPLTSPCVPCSPVSILHLLDVLCAGLFEGWVYVCAQRATRCNIVQFSISIGSLLGGSIGWLLYWCSE